MKKKTLTALLVAALGVSMLQGCGKGGDTGASALPASTTAENTDFGTTSGADSGIQFPDLTGHTLMIYCGVGMMKPFREIADVFKSRTGCEMDMTYAGTGQIQSQVTTSEEGDLFIAGSGNELEPVESYVEEKRELVKHMPVLAVQSGNPKNITGLADLTGDGVTLIMGGVDPTPIGKIVKKAMTNAGIFDQIQIEATTATAPQMSTALAAEEADAAIMWKGNYSAQDVEIVNITDLGPYIKTVPTASLSCATDKDALEAFNQYLDVDTVKETWVKYRYEIVE